jgi:hypothetical protein
MTASVQYQTDIFISLHLLILLDIFEGSEDPTFVIDSRFENVYQC